ncbi:MAG: fatty-acyl-CoA synthase [Mycobacterium sp.]|nr:fatty-acyl-CoA synthase [Mycobacterium sp.]
MLADCSCEFPVVRRRVSDHDSTSAATGKWGETPIAVAALHDGEQVADDELIAYARERMALQVPHPRRVVRELPRNATGKVLKTTLRAQFGGHGGAARRYGRTAFHIPLGGIMWI